jgi:hypothetical protein
MSSEDSIYTLVPSSNRGRYAGDDSDHGPDLSSGRAIAIEVLNGVWINGEIQHSIGYDGAGCYAINDAGRAHRGPGVTTTRPPQEELTQEVLQQRVNAAMKEGLSLADALDAATGKVAGLFAGYYFISEDGQVIGLCTGMRIKLL